MYEDKLRYFEIMLLKTYLSNFSQQTAMFPEAQDPNFQTKDMGKRCHGFGAGKLRQWLLVCLRNLKTNPNSNPKP